MRRVLSLLTLAVLVASCGRGWSDAQASAHVQKHADALVAQHPRVKEAQQRADGLRQASPELVEAASLLQELDRSDEDWLFRFRALPTPGYTPATDAADRELGLKRSAALPTLLREAAATRAVVADADGSFATFTIVNWSLARIEALRLQGMHAQALDELETAARLISKLDWPLAGLVNATTEQMARNSVLEFLLAAAGQDGWGAPETRRALDALAGFRFSLDDVVLGEAAWAVANLPQGFGDDHADEPTPPRTIRAIANVYVAQLGNFGRVLELGLKQPLNSEDAIAGTRDALKILRDLPKADETEDTVMFLRQAFPDFVGRAAQELFLRSALDVRMIELEQGPFKLHEGNVRELAAKHGFMEVTFAGDMVIVKPATDHLWYAELELAIPEPIYLQPTRTE